MLRFIRKISGSSISLAMRGISVKEFGGPEVLQCVNDLALPPKPTTNQILINVKAAGVNPVETYIRTGTHNIKPSLPYTPGSDGAGVVEEVGPDVTKFKKGDRVYFCQSGSGSYAEKVINVENSTFPLHQSLTFQQGAALGVPYFSAYRVLITMGKLRSGNTVLVHGASGAVGVACLQIGRSVGATMLGTAGTPEGLALAEKHGACHTFNHTNPSYIEEIKKTAPHIDVIVEMLANVNLEKDLNLASKGTRIVIVGSRGPIEMTPRHIMVTEAIVTGIMLWNATPADWQEMVSYINAGQALGWLQPVVGEEFPLERASDAHKQVIAHTGGSKGKIVLVM